MIKHYKHIDADNNISVHEIEEGFESLLPVGCEPISDKEAKKILKSQEIEPSYVELRASNYPPITDYLDAIVKDDKKAIDKYIKACKKIKKKYPKDNK